jgi:Firmicute plasmid replication protein (RepL)
VLNPADFPLTHLPSLRLSYAHSLPPVPAVYFCVSDDDILYIGITHNLNQRWKSHHKTVQLYKYHNVHIQWLPIAVQLVSVELEQRFIDYYEPKLNGRTEKPGSQIVSSLLWQIAPDKEITGDCWRVFACLLCQLDYDNFLLVSQPKVADHLNISRSTVSKCIRILCNKNILERGERIGNTPTFRLNPQFGWRGETSNLKFALYQKLDRPGSRKSKKPNSNND